MGDGHYFIPPVPTNDWLVKQFKKGPKLLKLRRDNLAKLKRSLKALQRRIKVREHEIEYLGRVTEVYNGVALCVDASDKSKRKHAGIGAVGREIRRSASVWPNAHVEDRTVYRLYLYDYGKFDLPSAQRREHFVPLDGTFEEAMQIARDFVASGTIPGSALW